MAPTPLEPRHQTVSSWAELKELWYGPQNFLMTGECVPFDFDMPSLDRVVAELRDDPDVRISPGTRGDTLKLDDIADHFRSLPIDEAMDSSFAIGHFKLSNFDVPGKFLHGFEAAVLQPWKDALQAQDFTYDRCYPIIFISGAGCATNYHMDYSHVIAWQVVGTKRFCWLRDPDRWAPHDGRVTYAPSGFTRPAELTEDDAICYDMRPDDVLWNALLTPHWVEAADTPAMSVNLSHGGLRYAGELSLFESELTAFREANPDRGDKPLKGSY